MIIAVFALLLIVLLAAGTPSAATMMPPLSVFPLPYPQDTRLSVFLDGGCSGTNKLLEITASILMADAECVEAGGMVGGDGTGGLDDIGGVGDIPPESIESLLDAIQVRIDGKLADLSSVTALRLACPESSIFYNNEPIGSEPTCPLKRDFKNICISLGGVVSARISCLSDICKTAPRLGQDACRNRVAECAYRYIPMKPAGKGCKRKKRWVGDGGCRCAGYCGYTCKGSCNRDPECQWVSGKCENLAPPLNPNNATRCAFADAFISRPAARASMAAKGASSTPEYTMNLPEDAKKLLKVLGKIISVKPRQ